MKQVVLLDMDGVLANFEKRYFSIGLNRPDDHVNFYDAVMNHKIFEELEWMPSGREFYNELVNLCSDYGVQIDICSSLNSFRPNAMLEAARQKKLWLRKEECGNHVMHFVSCGEEKAKFAKGRHNILIDDSVNNCNRFYDFGGTAILHKDQSYLKTLLTLENILSKVEVPA